MIYERAMLLAAELRSGKYKQGVGALTLIDANGWENDCCLGVACKVAILHGIEVSLKGENISCGDSKYTRRILYNQETGTLSDSLLPVKNFFGFQSSTGIIRDALPSKPHESAREDIELTELNDNHLTFNQIADVVTYFWEEL